MCETTMGLSKATLGKALTATMSACLQVGMQRYLNNKYNVVIKRKNTPEYLRRLKRFEYKSLSVLPCPNNGDDLARKRQG